MPKQRHRRSAQHHAGHPAGYAPELNAMENVWQFLRQNRLGEQVWKAYNDVVRACANAWNWFVSDAERIGSIGSRKWVIV
jgi:hypothetical protein